MLSDAKTLLEEHVQDEGKGARGPRPKRAEQGDAAATGFHSPLLKQSVRPGIKEPQPSGEARRELCSTGCFHAEPRSPELLRAVLRGQESTAWVVANVQEDVLTTHVCRLTLSLLHGGACGGKLGFCVIQSNFICEIPLRSLLWKD